MGRSRVHVPERVMRQSAWADRARTLQSELPSPACAGAWQIRYHGGLEAGACAPALDPPCDRAARVTLSSLQRPHFGLTSEFPGERRKFDTNEGGASAETTSEATVRNLKGNNRSSGGRKAH